MAEARRVTILGATGSVGASTVDLVRRAGCRVEAVTAHRKAAELARLARELGARYAAIGDPACYGDLKQALAGSGIACGAGAQALQEAALRPADWVMAAIVGAAGLAPTLAAVQRGAIVALANKEALVCAGAILMEQARQNGSVLLPVDSEHNAIFQALEAEHVEMVEKLILTASGGPFRTASRAAMARATPQQAVAHPNWDMGAKISVDSATMMNKGLELIEACHLFAVGEGRVEIVVHPESIVHGLVAYADGSLLAQLASPDMRTPIAHTLAWPGRMAGPGRRLNLIEIGSLSFYPPDNERFPALRIARNAAQAGGAMPIVLNAANEIAVAAFLDGAIGFLDIVAIVEETLAGYGAMAPVHNLDDVGLIDREARSKARECLAGGRRACNGCES